MRRTQRSATSIILAAFVPILLFGALAVANALAMHRREVEIDSLSRARALIAQIDTRLMADQGALSVLASSTLIVAHDWPAARERALGVIAGRPTWTNVLLTDAQSHEVLWETAISTNAPRPAPENIEQHLVGRTVNGVGSIVKVASGCWCISIHEPVRKDGVIRYLLTVERGVDDFQQLLGKALAGGEVAAIVDGRGAFIARSLDIERRIGTPATRYIRDAVARGGAGTYSGVTFEGLHNETAYATSDLSSWSSHVALPAAQFSVMVAGSIGFTVLAAMSALALAGGIAWVGLQDLGRRRREEVTRVQSQKMETLGLFAGTVTHDFNNLLTSMQFSLRKLKNAVSDPKDIWVADQGLAAAQRGTQLVEQLLAFARNKPLEVTCVDLRAAIEGLRFLLAQSLGSSIELQIEVGLDSRYAMTSAGQLDLALLNLATNARDAMPNGGQFFISTRSSSTSGCVDLVVRDTGAGMTPEVAARALEPFFTTKPEGNGTGLGLAQVHDLVNQSKGKLHLRSAPGQGTEFTLRLPVCSP